MGEINEKFPLALPENTVLAGQFIIKKVLGQGGFGITYMAEDHKSGNRVAIKEFFPDTLATRTETTVTAYSGERGENFEYGLDSFLQEAETLAKFIGNESIVRIHTYFEENNTAYFVMDYVEGTSFDDYIKEQGGKVDYATAERILLPIINALAGVHEKGIVHRDVTPDNIYITEDGSIKLLDFGAARYSLGDKSRSLDVVLKHGFAPKEQYTRHGKQGPYTDVYTVGACFYFALTGKRPPDSIDRIEVDDLVPPSVLGVDIPREKEDAILHAMAVQPQERFQSMFEFRNALLGETREQTEQAIEEAGRHTNAAPGISANLQGIAQNLHGITQNIQDKLKNGEAKNKTDSKSKIKPIYIACIAAVAVLLVILVSSGGHSLITETYWEIQNENLGGSGGLANFLNGDMYYDRADDSGRFYLTDGRHKLYEAVAGKAIDGVFVNKKSIYFTEKYVAQKYDMKTGEASEIEELSNYKIERWLFAKNKIFFASDNDLYCFNPKKKEVERITTVLANSSFALDDKWIYYVTYDDYQSLKRRPISNCTDDKKEENVYIDSAAEFIYSVNYYNGFLYIVSVMEKQDSNQSEDLFSKSEVWIPRRKGAG